MAHSEYLTEPATIGLQYAGDSRHLRAQRTRPTADRRKSAGYRVSDTEDRRVQGAIEARARILLMIAIALPIALSIAAPKPATADACSDAKSAVKDILSFNQCIRACQPGGKTDIAHTVQCLPKGCKITLTMSPQSAQPACTLGKTADRPGCQLPRVLLDCPSKDFKDAPPIRPSYLLCPMGGRSENGMGPFGYQRIEVGQDREKAANSKMFMADIPVPGEQAYNKALKDIISEPNGRNGTGAGTKRCNGVCHSKGEEPMTAPIKDENMNNLTALLSAPIPADGKFFEELAPYIIDMQPSLDAVKKKVQALKNADPNLVVPYKGSDNSQIKDQTLTDICSCIDADNKDGKNIRLQAMTAANGPKDQNGNATLRAMDEPNPNLNEGLLLKLCNALKDYQTNRSCGKDASPSGTPMACVGVLGGGKFLSPSGSVSELSLDLSGNAEVPSPDSFNFTNFDGGVSAFNYLTRMLLDPIVLSSLSATSSASGDATVTGIGVASINGVSTSIRLDAASVAGVVSFSITDIVSGTMLMGGTGEAGLAGLELTSSGP